MVDKIMIATKLTQVKVEKQRKSNL